MLHLSRPLTDYTINSARMREDFDALCEIGGTPEGGVDRVALSQQDWQARLWFADRVYDCHLKQDDDDAANLSGALRSSRPDAKTLLLGSHLDSVPNGGRYDGAVGIIAGLECLRTLHEHDLQLPFHIELINFTDDEGTWHSLFGARAVAGMLPPEVTSEARIENAAFSAALARVGLRLRDVANAKRDPASLVGYLELHIEHGTRLERANASIGVVTDIVGRTTYDIVFHGAAGHSGTTDMYKRRDALRGAAQFITRAHELVRARYGDGIFNCGDVAVEPGKYNIIPSKAELTIELRHVSESLMADMEMAMIQIARECAAVHGLTVDVKPVIHMPAAAMNPGFIQVIESCCDALDLSHMRLVSYAGHAAQVISQVTPCAMIFVPSAGGVGHAPTEYTPWEDIEAGANALLHTILALAASAE
ncbi:MAG: M20 family metallo-hydrolase [Pleurocapsa minor GSE-CHR-MK-17-07R]|nr:M20 family metallo-hydrolase [Pleurocapsa minor GSE-CHR-MK 17-07R]